jgi:hypothetical protein
MRERKYEFMSRLACVVLALAASAPLISRAAPADDMKEMVESGRAADAYRLAQEHPELLGTPAFDFYLGVAAAETGHAGEAVLALERYILLFPDNIQARLQLARAYFLLGEDARAREEFDALRALNPPADARATIDRFLDAIRLRESRYKASGAAYIEAGIGTDSNVNAGPPLASLVLPNLGPVLLAQEATRRSDRFATLGGGGYFSYPVAPGVALTGLGQVDLKANSQQQNRQFDLGNYNLSGGVSFLREKELFRLNLSGGQLLLGSARYLSIFGGQAEWQHQLDELQSFNVALQSARLDYPGVNSQRNAEYLGLSAGYRKLFSGYAWQPILSLAFSGGHQKSLTQRPDLVPNTQGLRAGVSFTPAGKWGVSFGYGTLQSHYQAPDAILGVQRADRYGAFDATVNYLVSRNLSVRAELTSARNHSNVSLFEFPRDIVAIKVKYEFK